MKPGFTIEQQTSFHRIPDFIICQNWKHSNVVTAAPWFGQNYNAIIYDSTVAVFKIKPRKTA